MSFSHITNFDKFGHTTAPANIRLNNIKTNSPITECLMMAPEADKVVPQYYPLLKDEPMPVNGKLKVSDKPGFGVELNKDKTLEVKKGTRL